MLRGRRPAVAGARRRRAVGAGRAASCCSPPRCGSGPRRCRAHGTRPCAEMLRAARRGHPGRGHGVARSRCSADGMTTAARARRRPARTSCSLDPERIRARAHDLVRTGQEFLEASWLTAAVGDAAPDRPGARPLPRPRRRARHAAARGDGWWRLDAAARSDAELDELRDERASRLRRARARVLPRRHRARASTDLRALVAAGGAWRCSPTATARPRACVEELRDADVPVVEWPTCRPPEAGLVTVTCGRLLHGFAIEPAALAVLTETDLIGQRASTKDMRRLPLAPPRRRRPAAAQARRLRRARPARHRPLRRDGAADGARAPTREYLVLEYAASKRGSPRTGCSCRPTSSTRSRRYVGGEAPTLNRLGGADWAKTKGRARKAVREIAARARPALRRAAGGARATRSPPTPRGSASWRTRSPTPRRPTSSRPSTRSRRDMERPVPMDRLICGDVGYGKTEIAVRAAFKAVQDGKQVAVLVPTTLLVQQHLQTFAERFAAFPVNVAGACRGSSRQAEAKADARGPGRRHRRRRHRHAPAAARPACGSRTSAW